MFDSGYGRLEINEDAGAGNAASAVLQLGTGLVSSEVTATTDSSSDLVLTFGTLGDQVTLDKMLAGAQYGVATVQFADGTTWTAQQLAAAVTGDPGPTAGDGSLLIDHGASQDLTALIAGLVTPGRPGDQETITAIGATSGQATLQANGEVQYTAPSGGSDTLSYTVTDQLGNTANGYLAITVDPGPTAGNGSLQIGGGESEDITALVDGLVLPGLPADQEIVTSATAIAGQVTIGVGGAIEYTAPETGTDTVIYTVTDQSGNSASGTIVPTIIPNGSEAYQFGGGSGRLVIQSGAQGGIGTVSLAPGTSLPNLWFALDGSDMVISILGGDDSLTIEDWTLPNLNPLGHLELPDGTMLSTAEMTALAEADGAYQAANPEFIPQSATALPMSNATDYAILTTGSAVSTFDGQSVTIGSTGTIIAIGESITVNAPGADTVIAAGDIASYDTVWLGAGSSVDETEPNASALVQGSSIGIVAAAGDQISTIGTSDSAVFLNAGVLRVYGADSAATGAGTGIRPGHSARAPPSR